ncbi:ubiquinol-cytochrome c reductase iron-sulfur subunit [Acidipila rosea]|uniref:Rieske Fe-S protein n=1 Tax=Acidipila rosea TaxID=768535 RepID=A0A4R1L9S0_9BACT|nr:ubiquinol-cytochrome c reductase iron-sulfur subunit [Acidipila rosea]TCK75085.1 Rieske Fe-S protein [Acidipila rosea]
MEPVSSGNEKESSKDVIVINRRSFFGTLLGIGTAGMGALLAVPVLRYVLYPLYAKSQQSGWSVVAPVEELANLSQPVMKTIEFRQLDGWREVVSSQSVYVSRNADGQLKVLSAICPHLGCSVSWQKAQNEFVCPCHGGRFAPSGRHVFGPPPRAMDALPHKVENGKLMVHFEYFRSNVPNQEILS